MVGHGAGAVVGAQRSRCVASARRTDRVPRVRVIGTPTKAQTRDSVKTAAGVGLAPAAGPPAPGPRARGASVRHVALPRRPRQGRRPALPPARPVLPGVLPVATRPGPSGSVTVPALRPRPQTRPHGLRPQAQPRGPCPPAPGPPPTDAGTHARHGRHDFAADHFDHHLKEKMKACLLRLHPRRARAPAQGPTRGASGPRVTGQGRGHRGGRAASGRRPRDVSAGPSRAVEEVVTHPDPFGRREGRRAPWASRRERGGARGFQRRHRGRTAVGGVCVLT